MSARHRLRVRALRGPIAGLVTAACIGASAPGLLLSSSAAAHRDKSVAAQQTPTTTEATPTAATGAEGSAQAPASTEATVLKHAKKSSGTKSTGSGASSAAGSPSQDAGSTTPTTAAASRSSKSATGHGKRDGAEAAAAGEASEAEADAQSQQGSEAGNGTKREHEHEVKKQAKERKQENKELNKELSRDNGSKPGNPEEQKEAELKAGQEEQERGEKEAAEGAYKESSAPTTVATPATSSTGSATSTSGSATSKPSGSSLPSVVSESRSASTRGGKHKGSGGGHSKTTAGGSAAAATGATRAPTIADAGLAPAATHRRARGSRTPVTLPVRPHGGSSFPLATTVTRFINVIPSAIWAMMGALLGLALLLAVSSRISAGRARRLSRQRSQLLEDVGLLQAALLPTPAARHGEVATTAAYRPASGPAAGGDFYDLFELPEGRLAVIVGDVSGHGRGALPHTTLMRFTLRTYLEAGLCPRDALQAAAPVLERQLEGSFATVVLAIWDSAARELVYSCAGHPPPLVAAETMIEPLTACSAPPIGMGGRTGTRQTVISIPGAARVCFYTDGVIEARLDGGLFGVEGLREIVSDLGAKVSADELLEGVAERSDRQPDDMAACVLVIDGAPLEASVATEELQLDRRELSGSRLRRFLSSAGLSMGETDMLLHDAERTIGRDGSALLRLTPGHVPHVELAPDNISPLHITARALAGTAPNREVTL